MVGDSVMEGAAPNLTALAGWVVTIDAVVARQFGRPFENTGLQAIAAHAAAGTLGSRVVIHLGTNGLIGQGEFDEAMAALAAVPRVVFVTVRIPGRYEDIQDANNQLLRDNLPTHPSMVVADWKAVADEHPQWFDADELQVHPDQEGRQAYADLIGASLSGSTVASAPNAQPQAARLRDPH